MLTFFFYFSNTLPHHIDAAFVAVNTKITQWMSKYNLSLKGKSLMFTFLHFFYYSNIPPHHIDATFDAVNTRITQCKSKYNLSLKWNTNNVYLFPFLLKHWRKGRLMISLYYYVCILWTKYLKTENYWFWGI